MEEHKQISEFILKTVVYFISFRSRCFNEKHTKLVSSNNILFLCFDLK